LAIVLQRHRRELRGETVFVQEVVLGLAQHLEDCRDVGVPVHSSTITRVNGIPLA
jgi:hypothetical protein